MSNIFDFFRGKPTCKDVKAILDALADVRNRLARIEAKIEVMKADAVAINKAFAIIKTTTDHVDAAVKT